MKGLIAVIIVLAVLAGGYMYYKNQATQQPATQPVPTQSATPVTPEVQGTSSSSVSSPESSSAGSATSVSSKASVEYTSQGFVPSSVTIKAGGTVTWTNKDTDPFWVASNPHPTHTDYPGFDALKNIPTNGTYSFTFTKSGTWGYHNHLNPSQTGTVIVQP